jgi:hypothetical protein
MDAFGPHQPGHVDDGLGDVGRRVSLLRSKRAPPPSCSSAASRSSRSRLGRTSCPFLSLSSAHSRWGAFNFEAVARLMLYDLGTCNIAVIACRNAS